MLNCGIGSGDRQGKLQSPVHQRDFFFTKAANLTEGIKIQIISKSANYARLGEGGD